MLNKLLRQHISIPQLLGYSLAALVGMSILFSAFCFYMDIQPLFSSGTSLFKNEFILVNKKISLLKTLNINRSVFTPKEIEEIKQQPFVKSVSFFTPCRYRVQAYTDPSSAIPAFSTDMFFESVPDHLLDGNNKDWKWDESTRFVPIVIPRDYLNLYNFGFAGSQGLPQISENIMQQINFKVAVTGQGQREVLTGRIVGFSDYLNTILVPEAFMTWANEKFGSDTDSEKISRLIVEVKNPADPTIAEFFGAKKYDINKNKGEQGKLSYFLKLLIVIVIAVGCLVMFPAIFLLFLSINLLIYKNEKTFSNLILLGFRRSKLALPYSMLVVFINLSVGLVSLLLAQTAQTAYGGKLSSLGIQSQTLSNIWGTAGFALLVVLVLTFLDICWIRYKINRIQPPYRG